MIDTTDKNHKIALALYIGEASDETFRDCFTKQELAELWDSKCVYRLDDEGNLIDSEPYDDEVYNALDRYGYWDNK